MSEINENSSITQKFIKARIINITDETYDTKTFRLESKFPLHFQPGQYFLVGIETDGIVQKMACSASSSPLKNYLEITVKSHQTGSFSDLLFTKNVDDPVLLEGPYGNCIFEDNSCEQVVFLGAGCGVAPLRGILHYIIDKALTVKSSILFYHKTEKDIIYKEELERMKEKGIDVNISLTRSINGWQGLKGRINRDHLRPVIDDDNDHLFYICGPFNFIIDARDILEKNGIMAENIRFEKYD